MLERTAARLISGSGERRLAVSRAGRAANCSDIAKKQVDALGYPTYMAAPAADAAWQQVGVRFAPSLGRYNRCPEPVEPGEDARRLFDIVGLDEGTCGRRPGHR